LVDGVYKAVTNQDITGRYKKVWDKRNSTGNNLPVTIKVKIRKDSTFVFSRKDKISKFKSTGQIIFNGGEIIIDTQYETLIYSLVDNCYLCLSSQADEIKEYKLSPNEEEKINYLLEYQCINKRK
jgi:hypothetical protein